ncbi:MULTISPECIES: hypothetical protein [unclassified Rhizobium]
MAISGAHIVCGYALAVRGATIFVPVWSETIALGSATTQRAPANLAPENGASMVFRVRAPASGEMFAAASSGTTGTPDPTVAVGTGPENIRQHLLASELLDIPAVPGAKLAVAVA